MQSFATYLTEAPMVVLYHGTTQENAAKIAKEGLKLGAINMIWATESYQAAADFAKNLNYPDKTDAAVITIHAPQGSFIFERPLSSHTPNIKGQRVARFTQPIPPAWIAKVNYVVESFAHFLTEGAPSKKDIDKELRYVVSVVLSSPAVGDYEYTVERLPIAKIITRERGFRYNRGKLVGAFKKDSDKIPPIAVINRGDGKYLVLDGHHRLRSAKETQQTHIWAIVIGEKTNKESYTKCKTCGHIKKYHNGSTMFGWADCTEDGCGCKQFT